MSGGYLAGIDLGGTSIKAALADCDGTVRARDTIPTDSHEGPHAVIGRMATLVQRLQRQVGGDAVPLLALGVGVPGLVDIASGTARFLPNLPTQWRGIAIAALLSERLACPVRLLNDVRTATLGELRFGHGRDRPDVTLVFFAIGTGIGGGVAIDGRLRLGPMGAAGELGHQTMLPDGPPCGCGNRGCLETLASGPAIVAEGVRLLQSGLAPQLHTLVAGSADRVTPREMLAAARAGDHLVGQALDRAIAYLGIAAANVTTILHPDLIVFGGGVAELGEALLEPVRTMLRQRVGLVPLDNVRVERSRLGDQAGLMGALALAQELALVRS
jgi:glucokinase